MIGSGALAASPIVSGQGASWHHDVIVCLPEGVLLLDQAGHVATASPLAETMLRDIVPGLGPTDRLRPALHAARAGGGVHVEQGDIDDWLDAAGQAAPPELIVVTLSGRWLRLTARRLPQARTLVLIGDVTTVKLREAWLERARDRLAMECESLRRLARELAGANETAAARTQELESLAYVDPLTEALNRRRLIELARREIALARRHQRPLAVLLIDIDRFKRVNDTLGHSAGDEALRQVAEVCAGGLRSTDLLARWGGEEFAAILPQTDLEGAVRLAERLRERVAARAYGRGGRTLRLTVSVGTAALRAEDGGLDDLIERVDGALYAAKRDGRNRVERAT
jgi:diguanylate cyclase (GGDEF)-like protein